MSDLNYVEEEIELMESETVEPPVLSADSFSEPISLLLSKPALVVEATDAIASAIAKLHETEYGALCVVSEGRLVGLLTERELVCHVMGSEREYAEQPVSVVMTSNPVRLRKSDPILYALHNMHAQGYRHVPIVNEADEPVSVVSMKDVVRYILSHFSSTVYNVTPEPYRGPAIREGA